MPMTLCFLHFSPNAFVGKEINFASFILVYPIHTNILFKVLLNCRVYCVTRIVF